MRWTKNIAMRGELWLSLKKYKNFWRFKMNLEKERNLRLPFFNVGWKSHLKNVGKINPFIPVFVLCCGRCMHNQPPFIINMVLLNIQYWIPGISLIVDLGWYSYRQRCSRCPCVCWATTWSWHGCSWCSCHPYGYS